MSAEPEVIEVLRLLRECEGVQTWMSDEFLARMDALLDGPLRETLRLARIGAWVAANSATVIDPDGHIVSASAKDYRRAALAADAPVEPPQGDAL